MSVVTPRPPRADDPADVEALEALIEEARRRARRRRRWYGACTLVAASAALLGFYGFNHGGGGTRPQARAEQAPGGAGVPSQGSASAWSPAIGLEGGLIRALALDPQRPTTVFAATLDAGVFKSEDGGGSWRPLTIASNGTRVDSLAITAQEPETVYAGTGGGVFKSTDGGASWQAANSGLFGKESAQERQHRLDEGYVYALVVDPRDSDTVYAGTWIRGLLKTMNGGASWQRLAFRSVGPVVLDPNDPETIYVGLVGAFVGRGRAESGVSKSTDGGRTWQPAGLSGTNVDALAVDPKHADILYAGTAEGLLKSSDGGNTWRAGGLKGSVSEVKIDPEKPTTLSAATNAGIFKSTDAGRTWQTLNLGRGAIALALHPHNPATLYAGTESGILKTTDAGGSWRALNSGLTAVRVMTLVVDARNPGTAYAGIQGQGVFKRTDATWRAATSGLTNLETSAIAVDPQTPETVYVGTEGGIFKSTDGAATWRRLKAPIRKTAAVSALAVDPQNPKTVYANTIDYADFAVVSGGATESGVFKSTDGGITWRVAGRGLPYPGDAGLASPRDTSALTLDPLDPDTLYAYGEGPGLFKSTNGGATWRSGGLPRSSVDALAFHPERPATLYAGTDEGIYKSTNAGASWRAVNAGLSHTNVDALAIDPQHPQTVYAGTDSGLFRSTDGGRSWRSFNDGLPSEGIDELAVDPAGGTLYVGAYSGGIFELTLAR